MLKKIKVLKEGKSFKIVYKPPFVLSEEISPLICHRLDLETSGLLLVAKNRRALEFFRAQFKERKVIKLYKALVLGKFEEKRVVSGLIMRGKKKPYHFTPINFKNKSNREIVFISGKKARFSKTEFIPLGFSQLEIFKDKHKDFNFVSLVLAKPITGRRHQIRVHLKYLGFPILGDKIYSTKLSRKANKILNIPHLQLFSVYLEFKTLERERVKYELGKPKFYIDF